MVDKQLKFGPPEKGGLYFIFINIKGGVSLNFAKGGTSRKGGTAVTKGGLPTLVETMERVTFTFLFAFLLKNSHKEFTFLNALFY